MRIEHGRTTTDDEANGDSQGPSFGFGSSNLSSPSASRMEMLLSSPRLPDRSPALILGSARPALISWLSREPRMRLYRMKDGGPNTDVWTTGRSPVSAHFRKSVLHTVTHEDFRIELEHAVACKAEKFVNILENMSQN
jgi:hypothetical protein